MPTWVVLLATNFLRTGSSYSTPLEGFVLLVQVTYQGAAKSHQDLFFLALSAKTATKPEQEIQENHSV